MPKSGASPYRRWVAEYFALLDREDRPEKLAPLTRSLHGALGGIAVDEDTYREHLEKKYL